MKSMKTLTTTTGGILTLVVAVICLNVISSKLSVRIDATEDNVYSLSAGTEALIAKLEDDVTCKLYFSRSMKELPPIIKTYATRVEEVLGEYAKYADAASPSRPLIRNPIPMRRSGPGNTASKVYKSDAASNFTSVSHF